MEKAEDNFLKKLGCTFKHASVLLNINSEFVYTADLYSKVDQK